MRVIAGTARGRRLASVPGDGTRPITDRAKEALFGVLMPELPGARVLDLFAGSGAVGIEALSRGAAAVDFIERDAAAVRTVEANLAGTGLASGTRVLRRDAFQFLLTPPPEPYSLVFIAPPQYHGLWRRALEAVDAEPGWLTAHGTVVVQIHPREVEPLALRRLVEFDRRRYGGVMLLFYTPDVAIEA